MSVVQLHRNRHAGFVYFLRGGDLVKIGFSRDPDFRARTLAAMSPLGLDVIGLHPGTRQDEARLHRLFSTRRTHGEWFRWCPEIAEAAEDGWPELDDGHVPEKNKGAALISPIVCEIFRKKYPSKVAYHLAFHTGVSLRMAKFWLAGQEMGGQTLASLIVGEFGREIVAALQANKSKFSR